MESILSFKDLARYFIDRYDIRFSETNLRADAVDPIEKELRALSQPILSSTGDIEPELCCMSARTFKTYFLPEFAAWLSAHKTGGSASQTLRQTVSDLFGTESISSQDGAEKKATDDTGVSRPASVAPGFFYDEAKVQTDLMCDVSCIACGHELSTMLAGCVRRYQIRSAFTSELISSDSSGDMYKWLCDFLKDHELSDGTSLWDKFCMPSHTHLGCYTMFDTVFGIYVLPAFADQLYKERTEKQIIFNSVLLYSDVYDLCLTGMNDNIKKPQRSVDPDLEDVIDSVCDLYKNLDLLSEDVKNVPNGSLHEVHIELDLRNILPKLGVWIVLFHASGNDVQTVEAYTSKEEAETAIRMEAAEKTQDLINDGIKQFDVHYHMNDRGAEVTAGDRAFNWTRMY